VLLRYYVQQSAQQMVLPVIHQLARLAVLAVEA
jgi:hypothetical protein